MDLGITCRWAVVCAASRGLGRGCAEALAKEGVNLAINSRDAEVLEKTAEAVRALIPAIEARPVAGDIGREEVREALLAACPQVDILININGGPPPDNFRDWDRETWIQGRGCQYDHAY